MWVKKQLIMLSTNEKAKMWLNKFSNQLHIDTVEKENHENAINQHLYFLSSDEIKEGDWYENNGVIFRADYKFDDGNNPNQNKKNRKIIAATDSSLRIGKLEVGGKIEHLPQIPQSFLKIFVEEYNKSNVITEVMVEYEEVEVYEQTKNEGFGSYFSKKESKYKLKVNSKNEITIRNSTSTSEEIGEKIVKYCKKYEGTNKYNDVLKAIEFGYQLSLNEDEK